MDIYPFKTLYIADLNAIQSLKNTGKPHINIIEEIKQQFPHLTIWLDAGMNSPKQVKHWSTLNIQVVLGSEAFQDIAQYEAMTVQLNQRFTLSLDFLTKGYQGPQALLTQSKLWPTEVIIMTLAQVGAENGVDISKLKHMLKNNPHQHFYAAGGVRNLSDLQQLNDLTIRGALIASALHNKSLSTQDLEKLHT